MASQELKTAVMLAYVEWMKRLVVGEMAPVEETMQKVHEQIAQLPAAQAQWVSKEIQRYLSALATSLEHPLLAGPLHEESLGLSDDLGEQDLGEVYHILQDAIEALKLTDDPESYIRSKAEQRHESDPFDNGAAFMVETFGVAPEYAHEAYGIYVSKPTFVPVATLKKQRIASGVQMARFPLPGSPTVRYLPENTIAWVTGQEGQWYSIYVGSLTGEHGWIPASTLLLPADCYGWSDSSDRPQSVYIVPLGHEGAQQVFVTSVGEGAKPVRIVGARWEAAEPIAIVSAGWEGAKPIYVVNPNELPREYQRHF